MADISVFTRLKRLFSTDVVIRNEGGNQLRVMDVDSIQRSGRYETNSLIDRYNRVYSSNATSLYGQQLNVKLVSATAAFELPSEVNTLLSLAFDIVVNPVPLEPLEPLEPGEPGEPVLPLVPLDPLEPGEPGEPVLPLVPLVPLVPDVPAELAFPLVPNEPAVPEVPLVPDVPAEPAAPDWPEVPILPAVPLVPDVPLVPAV